MIDFLIPDWPAPSHVRAVTTLRTGGFSKGAYATLNLADHVGDDLDCVRKNRQKLRETLKLQQEPFWLKQVHGVKVINQDSIYSEAPTAIERRALKGEGCHEGDASFTRSKDHPCAVLTADCLPVLLCDKKGTIVSAVHAGWKGLLNGVIEAAVKAMQIPDEELLAWMGPAIGPTAFEVDDPVRMQFIEKDENAESAFKLHGKQKWLADIFLLGKQRLSRLGITAIYGGGACTYSDPEKFFSFRRDKDTGRLATLIWIA